MPDHETRTIAEGKFLRFVSRGGWEFVERRNATEIVVIVAVTPNGQMILVEQYREPVQRSVTELPAGLVGDHPEDPGEALETAAKRELLEETGYEAEHIEVLTAGPPSAGATSEILTFVRARGLKRVSAGGGVSSENIKVHLIPVHSVAGWLKQKEAEGHMSDPKVLTGLLFALDE